MEGGQKTNCVATDEIMDQNKKNTSVLKKIKPNKKNPKPIKKLFLISFYITLKIKTCSYPAQPHFVESVGFTLGEEL